MMTRSPKKLRRLLRNGDIGLDDLPAERMRGRQVRKMVIVANTILVQMEKERRERHGVQKAAARALWPYFGHLHPQQIINPPPGATGVPMESYERTPRDSRRSK